MSSFFVIESTQAIVRLEYLMQKDGLFLTSPSQIVDKVTVDSHFVNSLKGQIICPLYNISLNSLS